MMTLFSKKVLISNRCISCLMSNLIKKSWKVCNCACPNITWICYVNAMIRTRERLLVERKESQARSWSFHWRITADTNMIPHAILTHIAKEKLAFLLFFSCSALVMSLKKKDLNTVPSYPIFCVKNVLICQR